MPYTTGLNFVGFLLLIIGIPLIIASGIALWLIIDTAGHAIHRHHTKTKASFGREN